MLVIVKNTVLFVLSILLISFPAYAAISPEELAAISVADRVESSLGTLHYRDGAPDKATADTLYDYVDRMRGVQAFADNMIGASVYSLRRGYQSAGQHQAHQVLIHENAADANALYQVANSQTIYVLSFLDLKRDGPTVIEVAPHTMGSLNDMWQSHVADLGYIGPDLGKGGNYLILPPGYEGEVPKGYFVVRSPTYGVWHFSRGFIKNGNPEPSLSIIKKHLKIYSLSQWNKPPKMEFINASGKHINTITRNDFSIFEDINAIVQQEPLDSLSVERRGVLRSIGIEKGKPFQPDERMKRLLSDAAKIGIGYFRSLWWQPRSKVNAIYPDTDSHWLAGFPDRNTTFIADGSKLLESQLMFAGFGAGLSPTMGSVEPGKGADYAILMNDEKGLPFDGTKTYKLRLAPNIPIANFWSIIVYDNQTRSFLKTSQRGAMLSSESTKIQQNDDGSTDIYFSPTPPKGKEHNWLETVPGRGWFICIRLYGPTEPWIEQRWRLGEMEVVD